MRTGRGWLWVFVVVLIGAIAALCVRLWPTERLLLDRAKHVAATEDIDYGFYQDNQ